MKRKLYEPPTLWHLPLTPQDILTSSAPAELEEDNDPDQGEWRRQ